MALSKFEPLRKMLESRVQRQEAALVESRNQLQAVLEAIRKDEPELPLPAPAPASGRR